MKKSRIAALAALGLALAVKAQAQQPNPSRGLFLSFPANDFNNVAIRIVEIMIGLTGIISVLFMIIGGYQYLTAGVNSDLAERGKKTIRNTIIGLIIVILSYIIVRVIVNTLGAPGQTPE